MIIVVPDIIKGPPSHFAVKRRATAASAILAANARTASSCLELLAPFFFSVVRRHRVGQLVYSHFVFPLSICCGIFVGIPRNRSGLWVNARVVSSEFDPGSQIFRRLFLHRASVYPSISTFGMLCPKKHPAAQFARVALQHAQNAPKWKIAVMFVLSGNSLQGQLKSATLFVERSV